MTRHDGNGDDTVEFLLDRMEVGAVEAEERLAGDQIALQAQLGFCTLQPLSHSTSDDGEAAVRQFFSSQALE